MYRERSHCRNYDEKEVKKYEKIPVVTLHKQMTFKYIRLVTKRYFKNKGQNGEHR